MKYANSGGLWPVTDAKSDKAPDFRGSFLLGNKGKKLWMSAWLEDKNTLSLVFQPDTGKKGKYSKDSYHLKLKRVKKKNRRSDKSPHWVCPKAKVAGKKLRIVAWFESSPEDKQPSFRVLGSKL